MEFLRYPGLGFVLEESSSTSATKGRDFGAQFIRPAVYVSPLISEERPQENTMSIDVPSPSWTHEEREELCSDVTPAAQPLKGEGPNQSTEDDPLIYVPQELKIPLRKDGQPGVWCMYHRSDRQSLEECRQFNDIQLKQKNGECYACGESGHICRDCPFTKKPQKTKANPGAPQKGKSF